MCTEYLAYYTFIVYLEFDSPCVFLSVYMYISIMYIISPLLLCVFSYVYVLLFPWAGMHMGLDIWLWTQYLFSKFKNLVYRVAFHFYIHI